jgi:hypothetical protein
MATYIASSPSYADVLTAYNSCADGDTLQIPAGSATWTSTFVITKGIHLKGAGVGLTVISDGVASANFIDWHMPANFLSRMSGIEFNDGGRVSSAFLINLYGSNTNGSRVRVDHCKFDHMNGFALSPSGAIGVIDNCEFLLTDGIPIYAFHKNWNGTSGVSSGEVKTSCSSRIARSRRQILALGLIAMAEHVSYSDTTRLPRVGLKSTAPGIALASGAAGERSRFTTTPSLGLRLGITSSTAEAAPSPYTGIRLTTTPGLSSSWFTTAQTFHLPHGTTWTGIVAGMLTIPPTRITREPHLPLVA